LLYILIILLEEYLSVLLLLRVENFIVKGISILDAVVERAPDLLGKLNGGTLDSGVKISLLGAEQLVEINFHLHLSLLLKI
jgi:hypothetical protein